MLIILLLLSLVFASPVLATDCTRNPGAATTTISSACAFPGTIDGVDYGSGSTNTGVLAIANGGNLTIGVGQTIAVGTITIAAGGAIGITTKGTIKINTPLYIADGDADGYPLNATQTLSSSGTVRRYTLTSFTLDCNDGDANYNTVCCTANGGACSAGGECCSTICRTDADSDGYYVGTTGLCRASNTTTDCNDGDNSYYPGNGNWYNDSGDHDCSGSVEKLYSDFSCSTCDGGAGRQSDSDGIDAGTGCGSSGTWWVSLGWGCWTPSTVCPAQAQGSQTQQCR